MKREFFITSFFVALFFCAQIPQTHAALLYFDPAATNIFRGDTVTIGLRIDTDEGECINTVDAIVHYDESINAVDVSRGKSILNIWLEDPVINEAEHTIHFAGGIPGGYCGRVPGDPSLTNVVLELVFRSPGFSIGGSSSQSAMVWVDEASSVLLHDGYGTPATLRFQSATINLESTPGTTVTDPWRTAVTVDDELPSDFAITLTKDEVAFSGKYFIVFNANDKQSGIDHYEVMEEPFSEFSAFKWGGANIPWEKTESPYVLKDQTLNSTIRVKVFDKAGNERIATLVPDTALRSMSRGTLMTSLITLGVITVLATVGFYVYWRRRQKKLLVTSNEVV